MNRNFTPSFGTIFAAFTAPLRGILAHNRSFGARLCGIVLSTWLVTAFAHRAASVGTLGNALRLRFGSLFNAFTTAAGATHRGAHFCTGLVLCALLVTGTARGQAGAALNFDGTNDYVSTTLPTVFNNIAANDFTLEAWFYPTVSTTQRVIHAEKDGNNFASILFNGRIVFYVYSGGTEYSTRTGAIPVNQWTHIAARWIASTKTVEVLLNGVLQAYSLGTGSSNGTDNLLSIGSRTDGGQNFGGNIDEVRVWTTARTDSEIQTYRNCELSGSQTGLVAYYKFNQGTPSGTNTSVTTATDDSGNGNNGTLTNFALTGATSNWVASSPLAPSVSIAASPSGSITSGTSVTFTATPTSNGGTMPTYQWKKGGGNVGTNSATYADAGLANGDAITCQMTSNDPCASITPVTSNQITMTVTAPTPAALHFDGSNDFVLSANNTGISGAANRTIEAWFRTTTITGDFVNMGSVGSGTTFGLFFNASGKIGIGNGAGAIISNATFNDGKWHHAAAVYDAAAASKYTLYVDGRLNATGNIFQPLNTPDSKIYVGNSPYNTPFSGEIDEVRVWNTARTACEIQTHSNCEFSSSQTGLVAYYKFNQGAAGGTNTGVTTATDASGNGNDGTLRNFALTGATSNWVAATGGVSGTSCPATLPTVIPSVSAAANPVGSITSGTSVTFTATPTNGGTTPMYQWKKGVTAIGGETNATYTTTTLDDGNIITCEMTSGDVCASPTTATSTGITMTVTAPVCTNPTLFSVTGGGTYCEGERGSLPIGLSGSETGVSYQLKRDGSPDGLAETGTGSAISFRNKTAAGTYSVEATKTIGGCKVTTTTNQRIIVNPIPVVATVSNQSVCNGASTTAVRFLDGSPGVRASLPTDGPASSALLSGGTVFSWANNTPSIGLGASGTDNIASFVARNTGTTPIIATITVTPSTNNGALCTGTPKTFTITVNPTPSVSIAASPSNSITTGTSVTFTATPVNGGTTPTYQWKKDGADVGTNSPTYTDATLVNGAVIICVMTSNGCASPTMATSNAITMSVAPPCSTLRISAPSVGFILCQGGETTISATATGGNGTFQYSLNGAAFQTNPVFNVRGGTYTITAKDGNACTVSTAATNVNDGFPALQCPQPMTVDASQMGADGSVPTSVSGNMRIISQCLTPSSTAMTDQVFDVNCGVVSPQTNSFSASSLIDVQKAIVRTFSAGSGIITYSCAQTIFVRQPKLEDVVFPANRTLTCTNLRTEPTDAVVNNAVVTGTGSPSSAGSTLNATALKGLTATFTDVRTTTSTGFTIQRTWTVSKCGTNRVVVQTITVPTCTTPSIAGSIGREDGTKVPATTLLFNSLTGRTDSTTGTTYSFANLLINSNVRVKPTRPNTDWTSGVTMLDVSLLNRHILDVNPLTSPYSIISADVNGDGETDATDMLLMQRLILRLIPALPNNNSWRFVVKDHVFRNPTNPLASDFPEILVVPNMTSALANGDFVAIKVGDLNQSAGAVNIRGGAKAFMLNTEDKVLEQGKTYQIPIQLTLRGGGKNVGEVSNLADVSAVQFTLNVDKTAAKINNIESGNLPNFTDNNTGLFQKEGLITAAWYRKNGELLNVTDNLTMMTVSLTPTKTTRLSEIMTINSAYTEGVAYDAKGTGLPVQLAFGNKVASSEKAALLPNRPNPFSNQTTLSFTLPEASKAKLTVYDLLGKVVMSSEQAFAKGLNEVAFDASMTPSVSGGIFIVRLQTATGVAEQKIVLQR